MVKIYLEVESNFEAIANAQSIPQTAQREKFQGLLYDEVLKQLQSLFYLIVMDIPLKHVRMKSSETLFP